MLLLNLASTMNKNSQSCPPILAGKIKVEEELGDEGVRLSNCQEVGPTFSETIVKNELHSGDSLGGDLLGGERALMLQENSRVETFDFGKMGISKFESGSVITDLVLKADPEVDEKKRIIHELVGSTEFSQVIKHESESGDVNAENCHIIFENVSYSERNIASVTEHDHEPIKDANNQFAKSYERAPNVHYEYDPKCTKFRDCSVRLCDLFSTESRSLGKAHSNNGLCCCVFCRGEYRLSNDTNQCLSSRKRKHFQQSYSVDREENGDKITKPGKCKNYSTKSSSNENLKRHSCIVTPGGPTKCDSCPTASSFSDKFDHVKLHVNDIKKLFECALCGKALSNKGALKTHLAAHDPEKHFKCLLCPATYKYATSLKVHMRVHNFEKPFKCEKCPAMFKTKGELERHDVRHSDARPFKCEQCSLTFKTKRALQNHTAVHNYTGVRPFKCKLCPKTYRTSSHLSQHFQSSHAKVRYSCTICPATYKAQVSLIDHTLTHNNLDSFKCEICGRKFAKESRLGHHMVSHSDKKPFECKQCSTKFRKRQHLEQHLITHRSEKPFKCGECSAAFHFEQNLKDHAVIHSVERPFECKQCSAKFKRRRQLRSHLISHTVERVYSCTLCPAQYKHQGGLRDHIARQHSSVEKLYECAHCLAKFSVKRYLKSHMVKHQPKQFKCKVCKALFRHEKSLSAHRSQHADK